MRVALVFDKIREETVGVHFEQACQELGLAYDHFWSRNAQAIPAGYDLYMRIDDGDYRHDIPAHLHPRILYATDTHLPKPWRRIRRMAKQYDLVCCAHRRGAESLVNGAWVPVACDPAFHSRQPGPKQWDLAFVGTEGGMPRKFYLQALQERYHKSFIGCARYTELGLIYSQAKLGFNYSIRDDVNMRIFEILCSGTLLLTNRLTHDDLERLGLRDREHLVLYRTPEDLFELIEYYLRHDDEREAIAARGMTHVQQHHTYRHRLERILQLFQERLVSASTCTP